MASGMITADVGLVEVPHVTAPAGLEELSASLAPVLVPDVCPLPIHFIPGVKNRVSGVSLETFEAMDIMRGEEVEACALIDRLGVRGEAVLVLPGSHTKFVSVGADGRIAGCPDHHHRGAARLDHARYDHRGFGEAHLCGGGHLPPGDGPARLPGRAGGRTQPRLLFRADPEPVRGEGPYADRKLHPWGGAAKRPVRAPAFHSDRLRTGRPGDRGGEEPLP